MKKLRIALYLVITLALCGVFATPLYLLSQFAPSGSPPWWRTNWNTLALEWAASGQKQDFMHELYLFIWTFSSGAFILVVLELIKEILSRRDEERTSLQTQGYGFPFTIYSTDSIDDKKALRTRFLKQYACLEYQSRFLPPRQRKFESSLDVPYLMLTGRRGLGKTRECIELFLRLSEQKGEEITILYPRDYFDRPLMHDIPADFSPRNLVLFIDDIHRLCESSEVKTNKRDPSARNFHERLASTIQWLKERFAGADLRVVLTSRDDPYLRARLRLDSADVWSEFSIIQLPGIHRDERQEFIRAVGENYGLTFENDALEYIAQGSDGTAFGIIHALAREASRSSGAKRLLKRNDVVNYTFCYPGDWEKKEYKPQILPYPNRRAVFEALSACQQLGVPTCDFLVTELAARFLRRNWSIWILKFWLWRTRQYINQTVRYELCNWMFEYRGEIICPNAYTENKVSIGDVVPQILSSFVQLFKKKDHLIRLLPTMGWLSLRIGLDLGFPSEALKLLESCERHASTAALLTAKSKLLARLGRNQESQLAAKAACETDPADYAALVVLSNAYSRIGEDNLAIKTAQTAVNTAPDNDYTWLNLGVVLSKQGHYDEAIIALAKARDLNPKSARAWYSLGIAYDRKHNFQKSLEACKRATDLDPDDGDALHALGIAYDRAGKMKDAIKVLRRASEIESDNGAIWLSLSRTLYSDREDAEALSTLKHAEEQLRIAADYDNMSAVAIAYSKNGQPSEARRVAKEVISKLPKNFEAQLTLVISLSQLPECEEEAQNARERLGILCVSSDDWCKLSIAYGRAGQPIQAVDAAKKALELNPKNVEAAHSLVMDLSQLPGRSEELHEALRQLRRLCATAQDWLVLSIAYGTQSCYQEAVDAADQGIAIDSDSMPLWTSRAMNLDQMANRDPSRRKSALDAWKRIRDLEASTMGSRAIEPDQALLLVRSTPISRDAWTSFAKTYRAVGRATEAVAVALETVQKSPSQAPYCVALAEELLNQESQSVLSLLDYLVQLDPSNTFYRRLQGVALLKIGSTAEAAKVLREVCADDPKDKNSWYALGKAEETLEQSENALIAYRKALEIDPSYIKARNAFERIDRITHS